MKLFKHIKPFIFIIGCINFVHAYDESIQKNIIAEYSERAPRPSAPVTSNSAIVGKVEECDQTQVLAVLAAIKKQITALDAIICSKFQQTWTILDALNITPSVDLSSVFTKLDFVCDKIENGFQGTFSVLNSLTFTVEVDLNSVFTKLDFICDKIENGFQETLSAIDNLTVTPIVDLSSVFTKLDFICDKIEDGFQGTFSILNNLSVEVDLNPVFTKLDFICDKIEDGFQGTFSMLENLSVMVEIDLNSVFTKLDFICDKIEADFAGTFSQLTTIQQEIVETQTIICDKFQQTWTILSEIQDNLGCPSTPITQADVDAGGGTFSITTSGNYFLAQDISSSFAGGLASGIIRIAISNVSLDLCGRKIVGDTESSTNGILVEPALSNIRIRNGTLQDMGIAGILVRNGVCDFILENITVSNAVFGFSINEFGFMTVDLVSNGLIKECQATNCAFVSTRYRSIHSALIDQEVDDQFNKNAVPTRFVILPSGGLFMRRCTSITVLNSNFSENIEIGTSVVVSRDIFGTKMIECTNCLFNLCTMNNNLGPQSGTGLCMIDSSNNTFESCVFNGNKQTSDMVVVGGGFGVNMNGCFNAVFRNCEAAQNTGFLAGAGFNSSAGEGNAFINCVASANNGPGGGFILRQEEKSHIISCQSLANTATIIAGDDCAGFSAQSGSNNLIEQCQAINTAADDIAAGYRLSAEIGSSIVNCVCQNSMSTTATGYGILLDLFSTTSCETCFIKNNSVMTTTGAIARFGYRDDSSPESTNLFTGNFGFNNGINYSVEYPSGPLPVVSGSLAGGLPATGSSGTFDNISIDP